jgi:hypothetical protein
VDRRGFAQPRVVEAPGRGAQVRPRGWWVEARGGTCAERRVPAKRGTLRRGEGG